VVKVERAECGDDARSMGQAFRHRDALTFHIYNRGRKSVALDLNSAAGREAFDGLVATTPIAQRKGYGEAIVRQALPEGARGNWTDPHRACMRRTQGSRSAHRLPQGVHDPGLSAGSLTYRAHSSGPDDAALRRLQQCGAVVADVVHRLADAPDAKVGC
jgi:hypothetical protein